MKKRSFNVLVADDEEPVCLMLSTVLRHLGHSVEVVYDGKDAIKMFSMKPDYFDILITDHKMPMISGLELVQQLRKNDFSGKIIVISGFLTEELLVAYQARRVDKILQKSFSPEELLSSLRDTLGQWA